jgi:hypothetical protein
MLLVTLAGTRLRERDAVGIEFHQSLVEMTVILAVE